MSEDHLPSTQTEHLPETGQQEFDLGIATAAEAARNVLHSPETHPLMDETAVNRQDRLQMINDSRQAELEYAATHDKLTGLLNLAGFEDAYMGGDVDFLVFVDGTNVKAVNDNISHQAGDEVIVGTAEVLKRSLRKDDILARIGGDEFVILPGKRTGEFLEPVEEREEAMRKRIDAETQNFLNLPENRRFADQGFDIAVGIAASFPGANIEQLKTDAEIDMRHYKALQHTEKGQYRQP